MKIDVDGTPQAHKPFETLADGVDAQRVRARRDGCAATRRHHLERGMRSTRLDEVLEIFLAWVE